jgi:glucokinase
MSIEHPICCIAVDLGATQLRVGQVDADGTLLWRQAAPTANTGNPQHVLEQIRDLSAGYDFSTASAMAVAAPGPLDTTSGSVRCIPTLSGWEDFPLRRAVEDYFHLPVLVENDAIAATVGEWRFGAGSGYSNVVYLTISTGIGGGIIAGGAVVRGRRGFAGHLGHIGIDPYGDAICSCGATGCFEALASGTALGRRAQLLAASNPNNPLHAFAASASAHDVAQAARRGAPEALALMAEEGEFLGIGITSIIHALSPDVVVLGGGVAQSFDLFETSMRAVLASRLLPGFQEVLIAPAKLGDNAGLIGAASLFLDPA